MTRHAVLALRMLRYRVAAMIWLFMLLGAASGGTLAEVTWDCLWGAAALAWSYIAATTLNDVADEQIDLVNHPRDPGRPLVTREATRRDLLRLHVAAVVLALVCAAPLGGRGLALVALSLLVGHVYSAAPLRLSYRTYVAAPALGVAYVVLPYLIGATLAGRSAGRSDAAFCAALLALFLARIVLKDFRDRRGDELYGKPTLLLRFGKETTCRVSAASLALGSALLAATLDPALTVAVAPFAVAIASQLLALRRATEPGLEQVAIGIGARMGNGLLAAVLAWLLLEANAAPYAQRLVVVGAITVAYVASFVTLARHPERVAIGYKG